MWLSSSDEGSGHEDLYSLAFAKHIFFNRLGHSISTSQQRESPKRTSSWLAKSLEEKGRHRKSRSRNHRGATRVGNCKEQSQAYRWPLSFAQAAV